MCTFSGRLKFEIRCSLYRLGLNVEKQLSEKLSTDFADFDFVLYMVPFLSFLLVLKFSCMLLKFWLNNSVLK